MAAPSFDFMFGGRQNDDDDDHDDYFDKDFSFLRDGSSTAENRIEIEHTSSRCAAFTLAYGVMREHALSYSDDDDQENTEEENADQEIPLYKADYSRDDCYMNRIDPRNVSIMDNYWDDIRNIYDRIHQKEEIPDFLKFHCMPCCWPRECKTQEDKFDVFFGFPIKVFSWEARYLFRNRKVPDMTQEIEQQISYIRYVYLNAPTWRDALYLSTYEQMDWEDELVELYKDDIDEFNQWCQIVTGIDSNKARFYMIPSDCASCS